MIAHTSSSSKPQMDDPGPAPPPYFETVGSLPQQVSVTLPPYNDDDFAYVLPPRIVIDPCERRRRPQVPIPPGRVNKRTILCRLLCSLACVLILLIVPFLIYVILVDLHISAGQRRLIDRPRV
ncbi:hypothetical protein L596_021064 [Steinernema carpocapsae]|nr:hypothetical protein L596_021064 [Steinernema carpocapsae]